MINKKADYVLALKGNQGSLRADVELFVAEQKAAGFKDTEISRGETIDGDHGRIETRTTTVIHDVAWLQERHDWPGLKAVVVVESTRESNGKVEQETRFYITSLLLAATLLGPIVRSHWAIENSLHWVMDMIFRDDECRLRTDHAPANFCTIKHMAQNLIRRAPGKASLRLKRKTAGWDDAFLASPAARGGAEKRVCPLLSLAIGPGRGARRETVLHPGARADSLRAPCCPPARPARRRPGARPGHAAAAAGPGSPPMPRPASAAPEDLFGGPSEPAPGPPGAARPLADRLRPRALDEVVGQDHLTGPDGAIDRMVAAARSPR